MKKFIVSILAILYLSTSMGATIHLHYCMGKLVDWGIWHSSSSKCSNCGMEKTNKEDEGCCKDEYKYVKNNADQKTAESVIQVIEVIAVNPPVAFAGISEYSILIQEYPVTHSPPLDRCVGIYLRNCVFRI